MPRNISFALTTKQFLDRSKDVTRRVGWLTAKAGQDLCGVKKAMGLRPGEKLERLGMIRLVNVRREQLRRMTDDVGYGKRECEREGFPDMAPFQFVEFFCRSHKGCTPETLITRLEFAHGQGGDRK